MDREEENKSSCRASERSGQIRRGEGNRKTEEGRERKRSQRQQTIILLHQSKQGGKGETVCPTVGEGNGVNKKYPVLVYPVIFPVYFF